ncbi:S8 family peptidase [Streptomyces sp. NBC_01465]|uniref:S8 family peptidase n=1 Tax=Streptomyces sp. NBC_01465 TaxID=2903878 RepID=UPI002E31EAE6|nr:S8 family serine peptidase [Streptomyces sp. NBC_01465]
MRRIPRTALGAAIAAVLAATAVAPSVASPQDSTAGKRPLVGSDAAQEKQGKPVTVTLVTGDKVLVTKGSSGRSSAVALPREDGTQPLVETRQSGKDLYVYPEGAAAAIAAGKVDEQLFNVTGLIAQGYDDAHAKSIPLIATYNSSVDVARSAPVAPRGAERGLVLDSIGGVALKADKAEAADFWADVTTSRSRSVSTLKKLWLDGKVESLLDQSTKQVNAPQAWASGFTGKGTKVAVLDTGADFEHPDLKGRITDSKNFTDSDTTEDRAGHGTHTASTVGGSGAASKGGVEKGVAPGTDLLIGKVLNDSGSGMDSWIIAGMQWAVDQKADVVSMSLGNPSELDCTDPMSAATEQLAQSTDTLFVIAAGNSGPYDNTVSSPGCAPSVLTVGAVDSEDATASFSSRGPVLSAHTLKPEIAAPGVDISAAAMGGRGVYAYRTMSGTSMATPHVAGAAAVLKQRHPAWTAQQIKAALVSSAHTDIPGDVRQTGAGRLDVKAAVDEQILGAPAVQGGSFNWPQDKSDRTSVEVPYTNTGTTPVKLNLAVKRVTGNDGTTVRSAVASLGRSSVTVPAGATVKVPLRIDPTAHLTGGQYGDVTGRVVATAKGVSVSTPFALYVQPTTVTLRVKAIDRTGKPAAGASSVDVIGLDTITGERRVNDGSADQVYEVRPGEYYLSSFIVSPDTDDATGNLPKSVSFVGRPQVKLTKDTTVILDARKAHQLSVKTDRPSEARNITLSFGRTWDPNWLHAGSIGGSGIVKDYYADVQGDARNGSFELGSYWSMYAPQISSLTAVGGPELHPVTGSTGSVNLDGTGSAELVNAGKGTAAELAAAGVQGKIALVEVPDGNVSVQSVAQLAKNAGAKAVIAHRAAAGRWQPATSFFGAPPLPALAVEATEANALIAKLATGPVTLRWKATAKSPYVYNLAFPETGRITSDRTYRVEDRKLGRNEADYRAMGVAADYSDYVGATPSYGAPVGVSGFAWVPAPGTRTEYYTPGATTWSHMVSSSLPFGETIVSPDRTYSAGQKVTESWYGGVLAPGVPHDATGKETLVGERQDNLIGVAPGFWRDNEHDGLPGGFGDIGGMVLKRNGEQIGDTPVPYGVFTVPAEDSAYELTLFTQRFGAPAKVWQRSTATSTTWSFRSHRDGHVYSQGIPMLFPAYQLSDDGLKTLPAKDGQKITLSATGHAGYTPGALVKAALSYSYDGGETWTAAKVAQQGGKWVATVDHAGADTTKTVTLKTELTDAAGNAVSQTVVSAYGLR